MERRGEHRERLLLGMQGWDRRREAEDRAIRRRDLIPLPAATCQRPALLPSARNGTKGTDFAILI